MSTEDQVLDWVRRDAETALHPSCTAKMGTGTDAVVDPGSMRVHGLDGLRVVDASVMPYVTNGNIYAPVMMIAERPPTWVPRRSRPNRLSSTGTVSRAPDAARGGRRR